MRIAKKTTLSLWALVCALGINPMVPAVDIASASSAQTSAPKITNAPPKPSALFTLIFDDGNDTDYKLALEIVSSEHAVACSAIVTDWIGKQNYMSAEQILGLRNAGWEIMSHTASHPNLRNLPESALIAELERSKAALEGLGITAHNFVYPYNKSSPLIRRVASNLFRSGRGGSNNLNTANTDRYFLTAFAGHANLKAMEARIDEASRQNSWCIIYHHRINQLVHVNKRSGTFQIGENLLFSPSGATGNFIPSLWHQIGRTLAFTPTHGKAGVGDSVTGVSSGANATIYNLGIDERDYVRGLLRYVRTNHPEMQIVTVDQGLDLLR